MTQARIPSLKFSLLALGTIVLVIGGGMAFFNLKLQVLMLTGWLVCAAFAKALGFTYAEIEKGAFDMISRAMGACVILMSVGALIGAWISAGTVPVLIYTGLTLITPSLFLVTSLLLCSATSLATGTSWGTIGTVGLALMGIGTGMGIPEGITAATIICGAYFGDKMSPLSDTTNMTAAVTGVKLMTHVRHMFYTVAPAYVITLIIYGIIGMNYAGGVADNVQLTSIIGGLSSNFQLGFIPVLPMILVFILLLRQTNPVVAILAGALCGVAVAVVYGGLDLNVAFNSMWKGYKGDFSDPLLAKLLNRGGVTSMLGIVSLVIFACGLGGMLKTTGIIDAVLQPIVERADTDLKLVLATLFTGYGSLALTSSCYFSCVMSSTLMAPLFRKRGLRPENCSRVVEDAATLGGPLVPWSSNALFPVKMLGVGWAAFAPWCFLLYLAPLISITYAVFNITMTRYDSNEMKEAEAIEENALLSES